MSSGVEGVTRRYLDLLRGALLDEHYLENELRIRHLLEAADGDPPDSSKLADPGRYMASDLRRLELQRRTGELANAPSRNAPPEGLAYTTAGHARLNHIASCVEAISADHVQGDLVDCGAGRGGAAIFMRGLLGALDLPAPRVWVADDFDHRPDGAEGVAALPDLNAVRRAFERFGLLDERVAFLQGEPDRSLREAPIEEIALLRLDGGDPRRIRPALDATYDRIAPGGFVVIDHYGTADARSAIEAFRSARGIGEQLEHVDWGASGWRRSPDPESVPGGARRDRATAQDQNELSVVVVVHNMRRVAARTLHSLTRAYQRGIEDLDYEVIVVENGSPPGSELGAEFVSRFGEEFQYLDLGDEAKQSPAHAVNRGIAAAGGRSIAVMIDGAHVLTPGVLRYGTLALAAYKPAVVTARQWYVGPGQQPQTIAGGYDVAYEDRLFEQIGWPADGYRLFDIGHFLGDRDWFDGEWESNCIFVPRPLLDQVGGMDESFSTAGGAFVNLDFFERMVGTPGVNLVTMLGEGSFHQLHGGTTTNREQYDEREDVIRSYEADYERMRGRPFRVPSQQPHFIGSLRPQAVRTRARRLSSPHFKAAHLDAAEGRPSRPAPVPEDLRDEFTDAYWRSGAWHSTSWLGHATHRAPADLLAYAELIWRLRPDWIVETRTGPGGRALFLASICDLVGNGRILSLEAHPLGEPPEHRRVTYLRAAPEVQSTVGRVREIVGEEPNALVILGASGGSDLDAALANLVPLVPVGSYVVVEDTVLGGHPAWPGFGPGPAIVAQKLTQTRDFRPDPTLEFGIVSFNVDGYLKRIR